MDHRLALCLFLFLVSPVSHVKCAIHDDHVDLRVFTVATDPTDGFNRFNRSANVYGVKVDVLGMGSEWRGGDVNRFPGGGQKLILLRHALQQYKDQEKTVILFTDAYDVILTAGEKEILSLFRKSNASILFSAESFCWPDESLASSYPRIEYPGKRFLNSGGFIGFADYVYDMISSQDLHDQDDDQLFLTRMFLNPDLRSKWNMKLDSRSELFQTLNGIPGGEVEIGFNEVTGDAIISNTMTKTRPVIIHGNGGSKLHLNSLANYLAKSWNSFSGCLSCREDEAALILTSAHGHDDVHDGTKSGEQRKKEEAKEEEGGGVLLQSQTQDAAAAAVLPILVIGIFIERPTPFMPQFFEHVHALHYPKSQISLIIHSGSQYHEDHVADFLNSSESQEYHHVKIIGRQTQEKDVTMQSKSGTDDKTSTNDGNDAESGMVNDEPLRGSNSDLLGESQARTMALEECIIMGCDYYLSLDSEARLTNPETVKHLIQQNKGIIAPLLTRPGKLWSNFWGSLSHDGFYARSFDYVDIVKNNRRGTWNVPHVSQVYLISGEIIRKGLAMTGNEGKEEATNQITSTITDEGARSRKIYPSFVSSRDPKRDTDMAFSESIRDQGIFMYVSNQLDYGHLVNPDHYDTSFASSDLHQVYHNQLDWEKKYLHPNYGKILDPAFEIEQPCPDVYGFPVVTTAFCDDLVKEMEHFGKWSSGTNQDERLVTGYENVPTRDIHMNQVGMEQEWLFFLREYIRPVQEKLFVGYHHDPPKAVMNFVVRYRPDEQPSLRPHHDSSTYTINIALSTPSLDYEGGGCRFHRYNCTVKDLKKGWTLMHPGRLTHLHEGLPVTKGTRYIMVSFVDP